MPSLCKPTQDDAGPSLKHKSVSLRRAPTCHSTFSLLLVPNARPLVRSLLELHHERADRPGESARDKNGCAWALLTCEPADLRYPEIALPLALARRRRIQLPIVKRKNTPSPMSTTSLMPASSTWISSVQVQADENALGSAELGYRRLRS